MGGALDLAEELAAGRPNLAPRVFSALDAPFSVYILDVDRLGALLRVAQGLPLATHCRAALEPLEPHIPWSLDALLYRRNCYEAIGDPRVGRARRDLDEYLRNDRARR